MPSQDHYVSFSFFSGRAFPFPPTESCAPASVSILSAPATLFCIATFPSRSRVRNATSDYPQSIQAFNSNLDSVSDRGHHVFSFSVPSTRLGHVLSDPDQSELTVPQRSKTNRTTSSANTIHRIIFTHHLGIRTSLHFITNVNILLLLPP